MNKASFALGLDYGTSSVRALIVRTEDGEEIGAASAHYAHGEEGILVDPRRPHLARQQPSDYLAALVLAVRGALREAAETSDFSPESIVGIGIDATASSPMPVDRHCQPLAFDERFADNLDAMVWLWKDHTAHEEAAEITRLSEEGGFPYMKMVGGTYSSEWFWSKILHCARFAPAVFEAAFSWLEQVDFIAASLTGCTDPTAIKRSRCAAGHKGLFNEDWGGLPSKDFLGKLHPGLAELRGRLFEQAYASDVCAGHLAPEISNELGIPGGIPIAVAGIDAHMGAVGSGVRPGALVKIIGTSTCDIMVAPIPEDGSLPFIPGMCGVVKGSVLPDQLGFEAGQSAVGDLFNWFVKYVYRGTGNEDSHVELSREAAKLQPGQSGLLALDWNNGNRSVLVDQRLTGLLVGQTLGTTAAEIYRALIESTAFGALTIIRRMEDYGARVNEVINCGGIAEKSDLLMQIYADVCERPMKVSRSAQTCALGAAIFGAVVGRAHDSVESAQRAMTGCKEKIYHPDPNSSATYRRLYGLYVQLHDAFGTVRTGTDLSHVMKDLLLIRESVL